MAAFSFDYTIDVDSENAVVEVKIYGMWDEKTAMQYHDDFVEETKDIVSNPWAKIVDLTKWRTSYDQVVGIIGKHMVWSKDKCASLQIYILDNPSTFRQLNEMISKGDAAGITHIFRTAKDAEKYLEENWISKRVDKKS